MSHICVTELGQHWFRLWLGTYSVPSHNLNQCWVIVNWALRNKLQWNFNQNTKLFIHENAPHAKWRPFCQSRGRWVDLQARYPRVTCMPLQTSKFTGVCTIIPSVMDTHSHGSASGSMFPVKPLIHCSMASSSQGKVSRRYFGTSAPCAWGDQEEVILYIILHHVGKALANDKMCYIHNTIFHWLRADSCVCIIRGNTKEVDQESHDDETLFTPSP